MLFSDIILSGSRKLRCRCVRIRSSPNEIFCPSKVPTALWHITTIWRIILLLLPNGWIILLCILCYVV